MFNFLKKFFSSKTIFDKINGLPDSLLLKTLCFIFEKLIFRVPPEQRPAIRDAFVKFILLLAEAFAKGAAEGAVDGIQKQYGPGYNS